jgi:hypothetical protein
VTGLGWFGGDWVRVTVLEMVGGDWVRVPEVTGLGWFGVTGLG